MSSKTDIIRTAYKVLFSIQIELEGYFDIGSSDVLIIPDPTTIDISKTYKILNKWRNTTIVILIETNPQGVDKGKPEIMLKRNEFFRFQVKIGKSFLDATHLASYNFTDHVLFVSNTVNNVVGTDILLSAPLEIYNASGAYEEGYLVQTGGKFYKATQPSHAGNAHGVTETAYWKEITKSSFISQADLKPRTSLSKPADLDSIIVIEIVNSTTLSTDYKLLDGSLKCREVIYKIRLHA